MSHFFNFGIFYQFLNSFKNETFSVIFKHCENGRFLDENMMWGKSNNFGKISHQKLFFPERFLFTFPTFSNHFNFSSGCCSIRTNKLNFASFDLGRNASIRCRIGASYTFGHFVRPLGATAVLFNVIIAIFLLFAFLVSTSTAFATFSLFAISLSFRRTFFVSLRSGHRIWNIKNNEVRWVR